MARKLTHISMSCIYTAAALVQFMRWNGIQYTLTEYRQYLDGTRTEISHTTYSGKERHKSIAAFNAAVKAHPGITAEMDIAKGRWER